MLCMCCSCHADEQGALSNKGDALNSVIFTQYRGRKKLVHRLTATIWTAPEQRIKDAVTNITRAATHRFNAAKPPPNCLILVRDCIKWYVLHNEYQTYPMTYTIPGPWIKLYKNVLLPWEPACGRRLFWGIGIPTEDSRVMSERSAGSFIEPLRTQVLQESATQTNN